MKTANYRWNLAGNTLSCDLDPHSKMVGTLLLNSEHMNLHIYIAQSGE